MSGRGINCIFSDQIYVLKYRNICISHSAKALKKKKVQAQFRHGAPVSRLQCGLIKAMIAVLSAQYKASKHSLCSVCLIYLDLFLNVCVHGWAGDGFYSLAALMLLQIRMLTNSSIWLHRSTLWHCNRINVNDVRYKPCSSRYPPISLFTSASLSVLI